MGESPKVMLGKNDEEREVGSPSYLVMTKAKENVSESEWQNVAELHLTGCYNSQLLAFEQDQYTGDNAKHG